MREKSVSLSSLSELELFKDRVHLAMESALRQDVDPMVSKKVAAKLVRRNSWREATRIALSETLGGTEAPKRFVSPAKSAYNWHRFVFYDEKNHEFDEMVLESLKAFFGRLHYQSLNLNALSGVALVDLLERIAPSLLENLIDRINISDEILNNLRFVNFCDCCSTEVTAFSRCVEPECNCYLMPQAHEKRHLQPFSPFYIKVCTANDCYDINAAPGVEALILETNVFDILKTEAVSKEGILDPLFHPFVSRIFTIEEPIQRIEVDRKAYREWIKKEWENARSYSTSNSSKDPGKPEELLTMPDIHKKTSST